MLLPNDRSSCCCYPGCFEGVAECCHCCFRRCPPHPPLPLWCSLSEQLLKVEPPDPRHEMSSPSLVPKCLQCEFRSAPTCQTDNYLNWESCLSHPEARAACWLKNNRLHRHCCCLARDRSCRRPAATPQGSDRAASMAHRENQDGPGKPHLRLCGK